MLKELLDARQLCKRAMKTFNGPEDKVLRRVLDARQLALKMLANVTYGYTAAGFSGRMPMAELADAIVGGGRYIICVLLLCLCFTQKANENSPLISQP